MVDELLKLHGHQLRHAPDRLAHSLRRRAVLRTLGSIPRPRVVLTVCHGNICRSPFAAGLLARWAEPGDMLIISAGFIGPGRPAPAEGQIAAAALSVDLTAHRSRLLTADMVRAAGLIIVMEEKQRRAICDRFGRLPRDVVVLGDLDPESIDTRSICDPVDQPLHVFEASYRRIERCVRALVGALSHGVR